MRVLQKKVKSTPRQVIEKARSVFNDRFGMHVTNELENCCIHFEGDLGFVTVEVNEKADHTEVIVTTREWEYQITEFLKELR